MSNNVAVLILAVVRRDDYNYRSTSGSKET